MTTVEAVYGEFLLRLGHLGDVCVAGGAVRDQLMGQAPKDYDVFLLGADYKRMSQVVADAMAGLDVLNQSDIHKSEPFLVETVRWCGETVQVMCSPCSYVTDLLDTFDWNVSRFAFNGSFRQDENIGNIARGKALVLHRVTYPLSTVRRGFRFSERFEMKFELDDIHRLCAEVAKSSRPVVVGRVEAGA